MKPSIHDKLFPQGRIPIKWELAENQGSHFDSPRSLIDEITNHEGFPRGVCVSTYSIETNHWKPNIYFSSDPKCTTSHQSRYRIYDDKNPVHQAKTLLIMIPLFSNLTVSSNLQTIARRLEGYHNYLDKIFKRGEFDKSELSRFFSSKAITNFLSSQANLRQPPNNERHITILNDMKRTMILKILELACQNLEISNKELLSSFNCCAERRMIHDIVEELNLDLFSFVVRFDPCDYCTIFLYAILQWKKSDRVKSVTLRRYINEFRNQSVAAIKNLDGEQIIQLQI